MTSDRHTMHACLHLRSGFVYGASLAGCLCCLFCLLRMHRIEVGGSSSYPLLRRATFMARHVRLNSRAEA
jgi:hypothetical protein